MNLSRHARCFVLALFATLLSSCGGEAVRQAPATPATTVAPTPSARPVVVGLALGGGAAKGFAHIGVIKMLEANGIRPDVVAGTSAGSVVGALYASGMDVFQMQEKAVALDESSIRDVRLFSSGLVQGRALQDYVNAQVDHRPLQRMKKPFIAVATRLEDGERTLFNKGDTGQAVRASSSVPGVFEPVAIGKYHYVDGGVVSPVPVDAAKQMGADFVIAVDISTKASGVAPSGLLGTVNQSIAIMGQRAGQQELARADLVIRPKVNEIGPADFALRSAAILEGEKAALLVMPQLKARLEQRRHARAAAAAEAARAKAPPCVEPSRMARLMGRGEPCPPAPASP